jgi:uncharacterized membrane protein
MTLAPLLSAAWPIPLHAFAALAALGLGVVQLAAPKGTRSHRALGYLWVCLMLGVAASSFSIHAIRQWRGFSLIHLLSIFTLVMLPHGVIAARRRAFASPHDDRPVFRRSRRRRAVYAAARTHHA